VGKAVYKVRGGKLIKVHLTMEDEKIKEIRKLSLLIKKVLENKQAVSLGVSPEDFARCIIMAGEKNG